MNTYLKYQSPIIQLLSFFAIAGLSFWISSVVSYYFFPDVTAVLLDKKAAISPDMMGRFKLVQIATSTVCFILPALLFGYFSSPKVLPYVGIQKTISPEIFVAAVLLLFIVQPFATWLGQVNQ